MLICDGFQIVNDLNFCSKVTRVAHKKKKKKKMCSSIFDLTHICFQDFNLVF